MSDIQGKIHSYANGLSLLRQQVAALPTTSPDAARTQREVIENLRHATQQLRQAALVAHEIE